MAASPRLPAFSELPRPARSMPLDGNNRPGRPLPRGMEPDIGSPHMRRSRLLTVALLLAATVQPATAGIFGKKGKPSPAERVPELLSIAKTDGDEHKRSAAVEELRQY